ncbi:hypothetical protein [uncultured Roseovarius sp.]|uniref:hypothetical protein n=1 Tax=uncultured Roseovarius sp. TaxID=293344 RepID=UPI00262D984A|nr:hypothetical protein [uncultured Roseovarius sp.]
MPDDVSLMWVDHDLGPATKVLPAAGALAGTYQHLIYCDDDWLMPPHWAATLLAVQRSKEAVACTGYNVCRLGRTSKTSSEMVDIAQGFSGVLVNPAWLAGNDLAPPEPAWSVDDIWLSGQLAQQGIQIRLAPEARHNLRLAYADEHSLQDRLIPGLDRDSANRACADLLYEEFGIWPTRV